MQSNSPLVLILFIIMLLFYYSPSYAAVNIISFPDPATENTFHGIKNFSGGDGVISIKLEPNRILWLFGDTFVGGGRDKLRISCKMVRNSVAVSTGNLKKHSFECRWKTLKGTPDAFFLSNKPKRWYWPLGGIVKHEILYVFLQEIKQTDSSVFGFITSGNYIAKIKNFQKDPYLWNIEYTEIPFYKANEPSIFCLGSAVFDYEKRTWIYGFLQKNQKKHNEKNMIAFSLPSEMNPDNFNAWKPEGTNLMPFSKASPVEFSVFTLPAKLKVAKEYPCCAIYSKNGMSPKVMIAMAKAPGTPFIFEKAVFKSSPDKQKGHFAYAGKAQPNLGFKKGLLCTYIYNCTTLEELLKNKKVYYPKFFRLFIE